MTFELFAKPPQTGGRSSEPTGFSVGRQVIGIRRATYAQMGSPEKVDLLWEADRRIIAVRPSSEGVWAVSPSQTPTIRFAMFAKTYELALPEGRALVQPFRDGELWCFNAADVEAAK